MVNEPSGGAEMPFAELADVNPRRGLKRGERYPYVEMAAVPEGGGQPTHHEFRNFGGGGCKFTVGDTLFARITPCTENGKLAYVANLPENSLGFGSTELIVLAAKEGISDPRFVYHLAAWDKVQRQAVARMFGTSGRQRVPTWFFSEELTVPRFSLDEQRAIAAVLDSIDEAIERTEEVITATERLRDALLHDLLTRGLPGRHTEWKEVRGLGTIPASWDVERLGDVLVLSQPGAWGDEPTDDDPGVRVLRAADLTRDGRVQTEKAASRRLADRDRERRLMQDGDLILERSGGGPGTPVGRVALIQGIGPIYCSNFCQHLRADTDRCSPRFAARALWLRYMRGVTERLEQRTTGIRNLDYDGYLIFPIPLPRMEEQVAIADALSSAEATIAELRGSHGSLRELKLSATEDLLSGAARSHLK